MIVATDNNRYDFQRLIEKTPEKFTEVLTRNAKCAAEVTWILVLADIPFTKVNYGCGVTRFIKNKDVTICKKCNGSGVVHS